MKKRLISLLTLSTLIFSLIGCSNRNDSDGNNTNNTGISNTNSNNSSADVSNLIEKLAMETTDTDKVQILLNGVNISNSTNCPFYVKNADKTIITLIENTNNYFTDATSYTYDDESNKEPNACIFSKDDLTIKGKGSLSITGNYNNGIQIKDDLKITGGSIKITSKNDAIKGKDSVTIKNTTLDINSEGDGIVSTNTDESDKGFVALYNGSITINSNLDAIQAETVTYIKNVSLNLTTGGGSINSSKSRKEWGNRDKNSSSTNKNSKSAKGIKY